MSAYRKQIETRRWWYLAACILALLAVGGAALYYFLVDGNRYPDDFLRAYTQGMACGLAFAMFLFLVKGMADCRKALQSEEKLRELYVRETDERQKMITDKVGGLGFNLGLGGLALAAAVASFLSPAVSITLMAAVAFLVFIRAGLKLYYWRKF